MEWFASLWNIVERQLLGMTWLRDLIGAALEALGLDLAGPVGGSIHFFLYDAVKIMVLLAVLILVISYIQSYFPPERTKHILGRLHGLGARCAAALLGTVTPFCSCSSIPLFIGFTSAGLPLGVTFSFLISSPMVDLGSLVLLMGIFGWRGGGSLCAAGTGHRRGRGHVHRKGSIMEDQVDRLHPHRPPSLTWPGPRSCRRGSGCALPGSRWQIPPGRSFPTSWPGWPSARSSTTGCRRDGS